MTTHIPVRNVETGDEWNCPVAFLEHAREKGWQPIGEPDDSVYAGMTGKALQAEITKRNSELGEDEQLSKAGNKPDLIATLLADDARRQPNPDDVS
jgi:uncharacterized protein YaiL (DUF2058 family)